MPVYGSMCVARCTRSLRAGGVWRTSTLSSIQLHRPGLTRMVLANPNTLFNSQPSRPSSSSPPSSAQPNSAVAHARLPVAIAGLGRMGARHAAHFLHRIPRAELVAAFTPDQGEYAWATKHLAPWGVRIYDDYHAMLAHAGLQGVVVASSTVAHADMAIQAMESGKHVLCEKPLSTNVEVSTSVLACAQAHPELKVMCGFSRRFDASYRDAWRRIVQDGAIGKPAVFRSQTCDKRDDSGFFVAYSAASGGIFVDCNIHDIDLCRWFLGDAGSVPRSAYAVGVTAIAPALAATGDVDNGVGVVEFWGGAVAHFFGSRMMAAGQHDMTEIIGPEGKITVNANPARDCVEMHEAGGIRRELVPDYYGRFEHAFVREGDEWTAACLDDTPVPVALDGAVRALEIGCALQDSLRQRRRVDFDEQGRRLN